MTTATLSKKEQANADRAKAISILTSLFGDEVRDTGPTVRTILRHVSSSGMSRDISLVYVTEKGNLINITYYAAAALGWKLVERNGYNAIRVGGCGMDMGFHTVYTLSSVLYRNSAPAGDAGYALNQEWL